MSDRFAIYYAPPTGSLLWALAARWLGRDPAGAAVDAAPIAGTDTTHRIAVSASARRYGFHATLKAPMGLAAGTDRAGLAEALERFGRAHAGVAIGRLTPTLIDGFLALVPVNQTDALTRFAGNVVADFEPFRAPLDPADRDKRIRHGNLTPTQIGLLDRYGYPYVMDEFRLHLTLTDRLAEADRAPLLAAARDWFAPALLTPYAINAVSLFHEPAPGAPFVRLDDFPLSAEAHAHV